MSDVVIRIEELSKYYRLGSIGGATLREDLSRWWAKRLGRPDPYAKIDGSNVVAPDSGEIWALRDVNLDICEGEILGIVGRNGAGKSTLLKIISKITAPTSGRIKIRGRVASLLEVGTGFHAELTGRENVYLNGTILGMSRQEVSRKLDEIVEFAGMGKFIDTPVKRYSSGMTVRLAFAVAAHLEPEILVIDEVLAVGDAAFQQKCLGKIESVSKGGRTVLFVSHNMASVKQLTTRCAYLKNGELAMTGASSEVVKEYLEYTTFHLKQHSVTGVLEWNEAHDPPGDENIKLRSIRTLSAGGEPTESFDVGEQVTLEIIYWVRQISPDFRFIVKVNTTDEVTIFASTNHSMLTERLQQGVYKVTCTVPSDVFNVGRYYLSILAGRPGYRAIFNLENILAFEFTGILKNGSIFPEQWPGMMCLPLQWSPAQKICD